MLRGRAHLAERDGTGEARAVVVDRRRLFALDGIASPFALVVGITSRVVSATTAPDDSTGWQRSLTPVS